MVRVRYVGQYASKIELKYGTLVRYSSRCEVRSTQILNVPYGTAILGFYISKISMRLSIQLIQKKCSTALAGADILTQYTSHIKLRIENPTDCFTRIDVDFLLIKQIQRGRNIFAKFG